MDSTLNEADVITIIREEWDNKIKTLQNEVEVYYKPQDGEVKNVISVGLKVRDKAGNLYTVDAVHPHKFTLKDPVGKRILVSDDVFEKHFEQE